MALDADRAVVRGGLELHKHEAQDHPLTTQGVEPPLKLSNSNFEGEAFAIFQSNKLLNQSELKTI